jgi:subtilisin family serine protease
LIFVPNIDFNFPLIKKNQSMNFFWLVLLICLTSADIFLQNGEQLKTKSLSLKFDKLQQYLTTKTSFISKKSAENIQLLIEVNLEEPQVLTKIQSFYGLKLKTKNYIPHDGFVIFLSVIRAQELIKKWKETQQYITWIGPLLSHYKTPSDISSKNPIKSYHVSFKVVCDKSCVNEFETWSTHNGATFTLLSPKIAQVDFIKENKEAINLLLRQEIVKWVEKTPKHEILNYVGSAVMQHGYTNQTDESKKEIWEKGITGQGEIVTMLDTGLDFDSCFFHEVSKLPPPLNTCDNTRTKVIGYFNRTVSGFPTLIGDHVNGHGTHVAGSICGKAPSSASQRVKDYQGAAPDAKIVVMSGGIKESEAALIIPIGDDIFAPHIPCQSFIHSNSWGSPTTDSYTTVALSVDDYLYRNEDVLFVVAAGNSGPNAGTIASPAIAKNVLTVGATDTTPNGLFNASSYIDYVKRKLAAGVSADFDCCAASENFKQYCCEKTIRDTFPTFTPQNIASFSSRGPTKDGRIKPDILNV